MLLSDRDIRAELAEAAGLSKSAASQHLKLLREAGLVQVRVDATRRLYRADHTTMAELRSWLDEHRLGLILDIVPNHMGIGRANAWWWDVLRNGKASRYADAFDIDWDFGGGRLRTQRGGAHPRSALQSSACCRLWRRH